MQEFGDSKLTGASLGGEQRAEPLEQNLLGDHKAGSRLVHLIHAPDSIRSFRASKIPRSKPAATKRWNGTEPVVVVLPRP